jgi:sulfhydrogenase subunit alpha
MASRNLRVKAGVKPGAGRQAGARTISVDYLSRVEGEGALFVKTKGKQVETVEFKIFEPPRHFEALLRGRDHTEAPDITSRICGICPIAYQMSSAQAMELALGIQTSPPIRDLRRLIYCGEWIESHALHVYMLHAPDFLHFPDAIAMAQKFPAQVNQALQLKKAGNTLVSLIGGREIHPINLRVGGFHKFPDRPALRGHLEALRQARDIATQTVKFVAKLEFPDFERDYEFVALSHPTEYPITEGRLVSNRGLNIEVEAYLDHFEERHVERSNALQSVIKGRGEYLVGPAARYFLNADKLPKSVRQLAKSVGFTPDQCRNPFKSIIVRALETVFACEEAIQLVESYTPSGPSWVPYEPKTGIGHGCTEAPRGILYHRYEIDAAGLIQQAKIVPPTAQNQLSIESDLRGVVEEFVDATEAELQHRCEQTIRNYDPCISCATHFLKIEMERG